jgi:hypothetical protein
MVDRPRINDHHKHLPTDSNVERPVDVVFSARVRSVAHIPAAWGELPGGFTTRISGPVTTKTRQCRTADNLGAILERVDPVPDSSPSNHEFSGGAYISPVTPVVRLESEEQRASKKPLRRWTRVLKRNFGWPAAVAILRGAHS